MSSIPTTPRSRQKSGRTASPSPERPIRSAAEVLADWCTLNAHECPTLPSYPEPADFRAYYLAAAEHAEQRARLVEEAGLLDQVPGDIAQYLAAWVSADMLEHATRMREAADRQRVDGGEEW